MGELQQSDSKEENGGVIDPIAFFFRKYPTSPSTPSMCG
jgi:hypothetical protein